MKKTWRIPVAIALALIVLGGAIGLGAWIMGADSSFEWVGGWRGLRPAESGREIDLVLSDEFDEINLRLGVSNVTVQHGSEWRVTGRLRAQVNIETAGGVLFIEEPTQRRNNFNIGINTTNYFVTITVPRDVALDTLSLEVGVGRVDVQDIESLGAYLTTGVGNVSARNVDFQHAILTTGVGNVYADGIFEGRADFTSGTGNVSLTLPSARTDYSYTMSSGVGNTTINGTRESGSVTRNTPGAIANIHASTGVGNVRVDFRG